MESLSGIIATSPFCERMKAYLRPVRAAEPAYGDILKGLNLGDIVCYELMQVFDARARSLESRICSRKQPNHDSSEIRDLQVFELEVRGAEERFNPLQLKNRRLLWYGCRIVDYPEILTQVRTRIVVIFFVCYFS